MTNFFLMIFAACLLLCIGSIAFIYSFIKRLFKALNPYFWKIALSIDQTGNVVCQDLFNDLFLKPDAEIRFGNEDQTVSFVLGKNKEAGKLYLLGKVLSGIINFIDKNHIEEAANISK